MNWTKEFPKKEGFYLILYHGELKAEQFHLINNEIVGKRGNKEKYKEMDCLFTDEPYEPPK